MGKTQTYINDYISDDKAGEIIFPSDFRGIGNEGAIKMALHRLVKQGKIRRLAHGIYYIPKIDPLFGEVYPGAEKVAQAIAEKEKIRIRPTGVSALNRLGLSTQVPMKLVYITDGSPRQIKLGKTIIKFKATTSKKLSAKGELSGLIIQALEELDPDKIEPDRERKIKELLLKEDPEHLKHDLKLAPARIHDYILKLLNQPK